MVSRARLARSTMASGVWGGTLSSVGAPLDKIENTLRYDDNVRNDFRNFATIVGRLAVLVTVG